MEEEDLLGYNGNAAPQNLPPDLLDVNTVDFDRAGMDFCDYSFHINYLIAVFELH